MLEYVREFVARGDRGVHRECRRCGTTLDPEATRCPSCGHDDVAVFRVR